MVSPMKQDLNPLDGGLREFEIILHDFNLHHYDGKKAIYAEAVLYSVNGDRDIWQINIFNNGKLTKSGEPENSLNLRKGICEIFQSGSTDEGAVKGIQNSNAGYVRLDYGLELNLYFDFSKIKRKLKNLYLETPFILVLNISLKTPIDCFSGPDGQLFILGNEVVDDPTSESGVGLELTKDSSFTFEFAIVEGEGEMGVDPYQHAPNIWGGYNSHGTLLANFEWENSSLVKKESPSVSFEDSDIEF